MTRALIEEVIATNDKQRFILNEDRSMEYRGDLLGDLNRRRRRIVGVEEQSRGADSVEVTLQAEAPLAELFGYANAISMRPARFEPVPAQAATR